MTCRARRYAVLEILPTEPLLGAVAEGRPAALEMGIWPWRAFAVAGALHLAVAAALLVVRLHLPKPVPDEVVVSVVSETTPQGSTSTPAPPAPVPPMPPVPAASNGTLPLPPPPAPPPPSPARAPQPTQAAPQGSHRKAEKTGPIAVAVIRQAVPYADNEAPDYSQEARDAGEQGTVRFTVYITPLGTVRDVIITQSSGYPDLDANAHDAALRWRFQPALRNGVPSAATLHLWIRFETR
jgi:protein TonB